MTPHLVYDNSQLWVHLTKTQWAAGDAEPIENFPQAPATEELAFILMLEGFVLLTLGPTVPSVTHL